MPVVPLKREVWKSATELPMGVMQPSPVTTTRFNAAPLAIPFLVINHRAEARGVLGGSGRGWRFGGLEFGDAVDHVAYGSDGAESFVRDIDAKGLFDLEGDV